MPDQEDPLARAASSMKANIAEFSEHPMVKYF
jgi:hypothetical protein